MADQGANAPRNAAGLGRAGRASASGRTGLATTPWLWALSSKPPRSVPVARSPLVALALCLVAFVGCSAKPAEPVTPSIVGVVASPDDELIRTPVVRLADGTTLDLTGAEPLLGGAPRSGELLIAGEKDGERWYYALTADDFQCPFRVSSHDAWDEPDAIVLGFGLRLVKAVDYEPPALAREYYPGIVLCVNERGEVMGEA